MKAGNAGAIILLGIGVLLLNLAYTGRASAVWNALRSGDAPAAADTGDTAADAAATETDTGAAETDPGRQGDDPTQTGPEPPATGRSDRGRAGYGAGWRTVRIN